MDQGRASAGEAEERRLAELLLASDLLDPAALAVRQPPQVGRYRVLRALGRGASSEVLLAEDPTLGREVAIKVLGSAARVAPERFQREMRVLARLEHPNIVRVLDAGVHEGRPYFVMEHGGDRTLADVRPPLRRWVEALVDVARACQAAHGVGVVHRDLKPSNVLLGARVLVADFGVAKLLGDDAALTRTGALVGTPQYMAPEQVAGEASGIGPWTDVYALGAMLYEGLTGQPPFDGGNLLELASRIASEPPPPPRALAPAAPPALAAVALRALAKRPEERFASAEDLARALEAWLSGGPPRRAPLALVLGGSACALLVVGGVVASRGERAPARAPLVTGAETPPAPAPSPAPSPADPLDAVAAELARWEATASSAPGGAEALAAVGAALQQPSSPRALLLRARVRAHAGQVDDALDDLARAARADAALAPAARALAAWLRWEEWLVAGGDAADVLGDLGPEDELAGARGGPALLRAFVERDPTRARAASEQGHEPDADRRAWLEGHTALLEGRADAARAAFQRLPSTRAWALRAAHGQLLAACVEGVASPDALRAATLALTHDPRPHRPARLVSRLARTVGLRLLRADARLVSRRQDEAEPALRELQGALERLIAARPRDAALVTALGSALILDYLSVASSREQRSAAEERLTQARDLDRLGVDPLLGTVVLNLVRVRGAREARLALAGFRQRQIDECEGLLARARQLEPAHPDLDALEALLAEERAR